MKRAKRIVSLLLAVVLVLGLAATVSAAPKKIEKDFSQEGKIYGKYPQYTGYDALNKDIFFDIWFVFNGVSGGLDYGITRDPGSFSNSAPRNWVLLTYVEKEDGDFTIVTTTINKMYSNKIVREKINTYYINTSDKSYSTKSDAYDAFKAGPAAPPVIATPPPTPLDQAIALFNKIKSLPILPDASGYVSLKYYATAIGGSIGYDEKSGDIIFSIDDTPIYITVEEAVWKKNVNVNLNAPIYLDGDDILVHASVVYPIYASRITIDDNGDLLIVAN